MKVTEKAHAELGTILHSGDFAIDATLGNGYDTQFLAQKIGTSGHVYAFDIQKDSIEQSTRFLEKNNLEDRVTFYLSCHSKINQNLPIELEGKIKTVTFNLGYLPGGDKNIITKPNTTLSALKQAHRYLSDDGIISLISYRGHEGGRCEFEEIEKLIKQENWLVQKTPGSKAPDSPVLFIIGKG
jgi:predicted methyltransferase